MYIVNVHPSKRGWIKDYEEEDDHDSVKDRINDLIFFDRNSHYDENATYVKMDYRDVIDKLKEIAIQHVNKNEIEIFRNEFQTFLKTNHARSKTNTNDARTYKDLVDSGFKLTNVVRIEHTGYDQSIYGKVADFTSKSIRDLIKTGEQDALKWLDSTRDNNKNNSKAY